MSRRRKTQALNSDQQTWGTWKRQPQHALLWEKHDAAVNRVATNEITIEKHEGEITTVEDELNSTRSGKAYLDSGYYRVSGSPPANWPTISGGGDDDAGRADRLAEVTLPPGTLKETSQIFLSVRNPGVTGSKLANNTQFKAVTYWDWSGGSAGGDGGPGSPPLNAFDIVAVDPTGWAPMASYTGSPPDGWTTISGDHQSGPIVNWLVYNN